MTQSIDNCTEMTALISRVREIVKFIKKSVNACDELRKLQIDSGCTEGNAKKLILDVRTRWNSCYMLQRFVQLAPVIS